MGEELRWIIMLKGGGEVERKATAALVAGRWRVHALIDDAAAPLEEEEERKRNTATMVDKL